MSRKVNFPSTLFSFLIVYLAWWVYILNSNCFLHRFLCRVCKLYNNCETVCFKCLRLLQVFKQDRSQQDWSLAGAEIVSAYITSLIFALCVFPPQIWFYTNDIFENAGIPKPEIQYTTAGTGIIEIIAGLIGVNFKSLGCNIWSFKRKWSNERCTAVVRVCLGWSKWQKSPKMYRLMS